MLGGVPRTVREAGGVIRDACIKTVGTGDTGYSTRAVEAVVDGHVGWVSDLLQLAGQIVVIRKGLADAIDVPIVRVIERAHFRHQLRKLIVSVTLAAEGIGHRSSVSCCVVPKSNRCWDSDA